MDYYIYNLLPGMSLMSVFGLLYIWLPKLIRLIFKKPTIRELHNRHHVKSYSDDLDGYFDK